MVSLSCEHAHVCFINIGWHRYQLYYRSMWAIDYTNWSASWMYLDRLSLEHIIFIFLMSHPHRHNFHPCKCERNLMLHTFYSPAYDRLWRADQWVIISLSVAPISPFSIHLQVTLPMLIWPADFDPFTHRNYSISRSLEWPIKHLPPLRFVQIYLNISCMRDRLLDTMTTENTATKSAKVNI